MAQPIHIPEPYREDFKASFNDAYMHSDRYTHDVILQHARFAADPGNVEYHQWWVSVGVVTGLFMRDLREIDRGSGQEG